jgi:hypothetical protein
MQCSVQVGNIWLRKSGQNDAANQHAREEEERSLESKQESDVTFVGASDDAAAGSVWGPSAVNSSSRET